MILLVVLIILGVVLLGVGIIIKGLFWLMIIGGVLVIASLVGGVRHRRVNKS